MGITDPPPPVAADWHADPAHWARLRAELPRAVAAFLAKDELAIGIPLDAARAALNLPARELVTGLVSAPPGNPGTVVIGGGYLRIVAPERGPSTGAQGAAGAAPAASPAAAGTPAPGSTLPPRVARRSASHSSCVAVLCSVVTVPPSLRVRKRVIPRTAATTMPPWSGTTQR